MRNGLRGDDTIAELCRKEGIAQSLSYVWSQEFMEAGRRQVVKWMCPTSCTIAQKRPVG